MYIASIERVNWVKIEMSYLPLKFHYLLQIVYYHNEACLLKRKRTKIHKISEEYRVRQSFRESYQLQDSEKNVASTETKDTSAKSP